MGSSSVAGSAWDYMKSRGELRRRGYTPKEKAATSWDFSASRKDPNAPAPTMADTSASEARIKELNRLGYIRCARGQPLAFAARQVELALNDPLSTNPTVPRLDAHFEWFPAWFLALWTLENNKEVNGLTVVMGTVTAAFKARIESVQGDLREQLLLLGEFSMQYPYHKDIEAVKCAIERYRAHDAARK